VCVECPSGTKAPSGSDSAGDDTVCVPEVFFNPEIDFYSEQGTQYFYYLDSSSNELTFDSGANAYVASQVAIGPDDDGFLATAGSIIRWVVPKTGAISISCGVTTSSAGASIQLLHGSDILWSPTEDGETEVEVLGVTAGDHIEYTVQGSGSVLLHLQIMFVFSFKYDLSMEQGYNGWFYTFGADFTPMVPYADGNGWKSPSDTNPRVDLAASAIDDSYAFRLHPGLSADAIVRWAVPEDGSVRVFGYFQDRNNVGDGQNGRIVYNGEAVFGPRLLTLNTEYVYFDFTIDVFAGEFLDVAVDNNNNGDSGGDGTFTEVTVTYLL
jgi:hypothetical protein